LKVRSQPVSLPNLTTKSITQRIGLEHHTGPFALAGFAVDLRENYTAGLIGLGFKVISAGSRAAFVEALACWSLGIAVSQSSSRIKNFNWLIRFSEDAVEGPLVDAAKMFLKDPQPAISEPRVEYRDRAKAWPFRLPAIYGVVASKKVKE
jgi:hypothetical protein